MTVAVMDGVPSGPTGRQEDRNGEGRCTRGTHLAAD
jgi:hypothetical protein